MNKHIKKAMLKLMNLGLGIVVTAGILNTLYVAAIAADPVLMAPVVAMIDVKVSLAKDMLAPLLGSSVGLMGMKFMLTAMKSTNNDAEIKTDERLMSNETKMLSIESNIMGAVDEIVNGMNSQLDTMKTSIAIQNKMLEFYQIESNSKLNVSDNLISPEIKAQHIEWQDELDNLNEQMKTYKLKNIYKITEVVKNIIIEATEEIDPRVSEIIGDKDEEII